MEILQNFHIEILEKLDADTIFDEDIKNVKTFLKVKILKANEEMEN